ncbi:hypothetical protein [Nocardioides sp. URHA0020]|uniref:hypothetical protein n=1 Tax=Nocardioides sp. URHA0020 TaxID=1380392 RepID=UPI00048A8E17|nr:hypothetical protein [Nocardioides sp. URHA0020]
MTQPAVPADDRLPRSAYVLAGLFLADQLLQLQDHGLSRSDGVWVLLSMVLSAAVVAWFAAGVLRARTVRLVVVWVLLGLAALLGVIGTLSGPDVRGLIDLAFTVGELVALGVFCSTHYFQRQRARAPGPGAHLGAVLAVSAVVGLLGGLTAPTDGDNPPTQLRITL